MPTTGQVNPPPTTGAGGTVPVGAGGTATVLPGAGGTPVGGPPGAGGVAQVGGGGAPTAMGTEYTFVTGHFMVPPGGEVYKCQDFQNPFGKDIAVVQDVTTLTPGSHHMFAFVMPNVQLTLMNNLVDCPGGGVEFHDFLATSGSPVATTTYPASTGRIFHATDGLRLDVHLFNTTSDAKDAFVTFKVTFTDPGAVTNKVASMFLNQVLLSVPPGMSTQSRTYTLAQDINLMGTGSHMHKQGVHFVATANGMNLYDGTEWQEPMPRVYNPPLHLTAGTRITWACTYNNQTGQTLTFGESASKNEMCIYEGEFFNATGTQISYQSVF